MKPSSFLNYDGSTHTVSNAQGESKTLSPQCAALLAMFLEEPQGIVTREQIRQTIWQHNNVVSEDLINHLIYRLKKELNCLPNTPAWHIEVIPKTGYHLVVESATSPVKTSWWQNCWQWLERWRLKP
ncbi:response regulator transcription factor [Salinimonas marina]|uniref:Response regulator transcription factor n=1 Tax=Salinimonas marina TaxID=2785918 RepID=A0A7S9DW56_9ALTE|nr:winged helix-turn-helix domain-containing protein [Salinimonas marina]QPG05079.1 response regulator transcription factor [Salinimonas marina]